jgi:hypothetical protein
VDKTTGVRSDNTVILTAGNSVKAYPDQLRRVSYLDVKTRKRIQVPNQQLQLAGTYYCPDLQVTLAGGIVLQVDQTAPTNQGLLR